MDNLFNSTKFSEQALNESGKDVMTHGVCQQNRGIPKCIVQDVVTKKKEPLRHRGTLEAAVLTGDPECKYLVVVSLCEASTISACYG